MAYIFVAVGQGCGIAVRWGLPHLAAFLFLMHLLYLDDSGSVANRQEDYLVLGGLSVFESQSIYVTRELDKLAERIWPEDPTQVEFHASDVFSGRKPPWSGMSKDERRATIKNVLRILDSCYGSARVFACAVHKASFPNADPMELAFEDL